MDTGLNFNSRLRYSKTWPRLTAVQKKNAVLIYDRRLTQQAAPLIRQFKNSLAVTAGENLKSFAQAEKTIRRLLKRTQNLSRSEVQIVALGGGSVGDFAGFCASILRRGTPLIQIPSTWLSAVDSAHGGKTALNVAAVKNQVGTYWPAHEVWLIEKLLVAQPEARAIEARGEVYKSALIAGGSLFRSVDRSDARNPNQQLWKLLPRVIQAKMQIVRQDPLETQGLRHQLNLGHTVGHVLEAKNSLPHGIAVLLGLAFVIQWQQHRLKMQGNFQQPRWIEQVVQWPGWPNSAWLHRELRRVRNWAGALTTDKKSLGQGRIRFIVPYAPGNVRVETFTVTEVVREIERQLE